MKMAEALQALGGRTLLSHEVDRVLIEKGKAVGVHLKGGHDLRAKTVVSNIDAYATFSALKGENILPERYLAKLRSLRPSLSYFILYLGIEGPLDGFSSPNHEVFFDENLNEEYQTIYQNQIPEKAPFYLLAPSLVNPSHAPAGNHTLCLSYKVPYHFSPDWDDRIKDQLAHRLIERASALISGLEKRILVRAETTPKTIEERTGNPYGAAYGWAQTPRQSGMYRLQRTTPIPNLFLTGHWTSPGGGISGVVASGELTARVILDKFEQGKD